VIVLVGVDGAIAVGVKEDVGVGGRGDGELVRAGRAVEVGEANGEAVAAVGRQAESRRPVNINIKNRAKDREFNVLRITNILYHS
jgi:hypothetical protein